MFSNVARQGGCRLWHILFSVEIKNCCWLILTRRNNRKDQEQGDTIPESGSVHSAARWATPRLFRDLLIAWLFFPLTASSLELPVTFYFSIVACRWLVYLAEACYRTCSQKLCRMVDHWLLVWNASIEYDPIAGHSRSSQRTQSCPSTGVRILTSEFQLN